MARLVDQFDDIVVKDLFHRNQYQSASSGNIILNLYSHITGNTANVSVAEVVSIDALNQGQWDLCVNSSARQLVANTITTANVASLTANALISVRAGNTNFRSSNVNIVGNLVVSQRLTANVGRFASCILAGLEVTDTATIAGNVSVAGSLVVANTISVGKVAGRRIDLSNNAIQFSSNGAVDSSITTIGATANAGDGTGELVLDGKDYTYIGTTFNNGINPSTGVVSIQAYPLYPIITDSAQSIRQYALAQRFWSGKVPNSTATPQTLQFWGNGNYPLYGTYSVQYMTKNGTYYNAVAMVMRGSEASPGNTSAVRWATLSSSTSNTAGLSVTFGVVSSWVPQISFANTTSVNAWFQVSAVVFDDAAIHGEAAS